MPFLIPTPALVLHSVVHDSSVLQIFTAPISTLEDYPKDFTSSPGLLRISAIILPYRELNLLLAAEIKGVTEYKRDWRIWSSCIRHTLSRPSTPTGSVYRI